MAITRGSEYGADGMERQGLTDYEICEMITTLVTMAARVVILEIFGFVKTTLIVLFYERYVAVTKDVAPTATATVATTIITTAGVQGGGVQVWDFNNMKSSDFDGVNDPIVNMIWISNVDGYFFSCSCPNDPNVKFALNLFHLGVKDWWKLVTSVYSLVEKAIVTWEQFMKMFRIKYVPLVESERVAEEYLSLKQMIDSVMEIIKIFPEIALLCPKYAASEQV